MIELEAGDYWAVLEADDAYRDNFVTATFNVEINYDQPGSPTWGYFYLYPPSSDTKSFIHRRSGKFTENYDNYYAEQPSL